MVRCKSAVEGQKGEFGILGSGTCKAHSLNLITFDHLTVMMAPSAVRLRSLAHRLRPGSKSRWDCTNKFDFLKKEKNPTKQAAQNVRSKELCKLSVVKICFKISNVIGSFWTLESPFTRLTPLRIDVTYQLFSRGLLKLASRCTSLTIFKYCLTELKHRRRERKAM